MIANTLTNSEYQPLFSKLCTFSSCLILSHVDIDGDGLGSIIALKQALLPYISTIELGFPGTLSANYHFLNDHILLPDGNVPNREYPLVIACDAGSILRLGQYQNYFNKAILTINIDHHIDNTLYGMINIVENCSSVGELLFSLFQLWNIPLSPIIALSLGLSIVTDTGRFQYPSCVSRTFQYYAQLLEAGLDHTYLMNGLYASVTKDRLALQKEMLSNLIINGSIAYSFITSINGDNEGLIEMIRSIEGINIAFLIRPSDNGKFKLSLRSKNIRFNVQKIAQMLQGGGHPMAAGAILDEPTLEKNIQTVLTIIQRTIS